MIFGERKIVISCTLVECSVRVMILMKQGKVDRGTYPGKLMTEKIVL